MIEPGRLCIKLAGRDAGKRAVIVDVLERGWVLIDGLTRRKKVNLTHLELLPQSIKLKAGASHAEVVRAFKTQLGIEIKKGKPRKPGPRPMRKRKFEPTRGT